MKTSHSPQNHHPDKDEVSSNEMRPRVQTAPGAHNARENSREPNPEDQQKIQRFEKEIGNIQRMLKSFGDQIRIFSPLGSVQTFLSKFFLVIFFFEFFFGKFFVNCFEIFFWNF